MEVATTISRPFSWNRFRSNLNGGTSSSNLSKFGDRSGIQLRSVEYSTSFSMEVERQFARSSRGEAGISEGRVRHLSDAIATDRLRCVVMLSLQIRFMTGRTVQTGRAFHRAPPFSVSLVIISWIEFRDAKFRHNPRTPRLILPWYAGDCFCEYEIHFYSVVELIGRCLQGLIEVQYLFLVI